MATRFVLTVTNVVAAAFMFVDMSLRLNTIVNRDAKTASRSMGKKLQ